MSHVTDHNFLSSFASEEDLKHTAAADLPHLVRKVRSSIAARSADADVPHGLPLIELTVALHRSFDTRLDRLVWQLPALEPASPAPRRRQLRVDPSHRAAGTVTADELSEDPSAFEREAAEEFDAARLSGAIGMAYARGRLSERNWVVAIVSATASLSGSLVKQLRQAAGAGAPLLLVVCHLQGDTPKARGMLARQRKWKRLADTTGLASNGTLPGDDVAQLVQSLERAKQTGRASLLQVAIGPPVETDPQSTGPEERTVAAEPVAREFFQVAREHVADLASRDQSVMAVNLGYEPRLLGDWPGKLKSQDISIVQEVPQALAWCAGSAAGGCRTVLFVSRQAFHQHFGPLREQILLSGVAVTLLIDAASADDATTAAEGDVAALAAMPSVAVLAPAGPMELRQMIDWSLDQPTASAILLPQIASSLPERSLLVPIDRGAAELLVAGEDVVLLALGSMVAPACGAAEQLGKRKISAGVVNLRFAQPLDRAQLTELCGRSMSVVVLQDPSENGGVAGRVLELLAATGVAQNVSVLSPFAGLEARTDAVRQSIAVRRIVERCRWLAEPSVPGLTFIADEWHGSLAPYTMAAPIESAAPIQQPWLSLALPEIAREYDVRQEVARQRLSHDVETWMQSYLRVGRRKLYFWQWCVLGAELTTMPCVLPALRAHVCETKVLSIMLCVLLDDVADLVGKKPLLEVLLAIIGNQGQPDLSLLEDEDRAYAAVTQELSDIYQARIRDYPTYAHYEDLLNYDLLQYFNTMRYSHLLNHDLALLNVAEHDIYMPHAMHMMSFSTLDLMCTPDFDPAELGRMREVIWHAQCMGRIGNLLGTWRREISEHDFNSGVFARAVVEGDLSPDDLAEADEDLIEAAIVDGRHEDHFLAQWHHHKRLCERRAESIRSVRLAGFVAGQERFFHMHLGCRGLI